MKRKYLGMLLLTSLVVGATACASYGPRSGPTPPGTPTDVTVHVFYQDLLPYGSWIQVDAYGWVWVPSGMDAAWRPYTHGQWVYTTVGWTWVSDWAWGWAPFHYGRWVHHGHHGWAWKPGQVWAPAWVAWRLGDGWIGWAPLPLDAQWRLGVGLDLGAVELNAAIAADWWVFVAEARFLGPRLQTRIVSPERNPPLAAATRNVTRYVQEGGWVAERGLPVARLEAVLGRPVTRYRIEDLNRPPARATARADRGSVTMYRPPAASTRSRSSRGRRNKPGP